MSTLREDPMPGTARYPVRPRRNLRVARGILLVGMVVVGVGPGCRRGSSGSEAIEYTIRFPAPQTQMAEVEVVVPTERQPEVLLMMPVWSPGFYRVQDYAAKIREISARTPEGEPLRVERVSSNRWRVQTSEAPEVVVTYRLHCPDSFVTTNWVSPELLVLNGSATYLTLVGGEERPHEVWLQPADSWSGVATGLAELPEEGPYHFRADDYDTLVDSPIVAGDLEVTTFVVDGIEHQLVDVGEREGWSSARAAEDLQDVIEETLPLWGELPYQKYVFLNVFRRGGGGLEHENSTLLTTSAQAMATPERYRSWLSFASHEYFHAFNVKRLRPVGLGPFDYENPPSTPSLWLSEGCTSYFGDLFVARAGLMSAGEYLVARSSAIRVQGHCGGGSGSGSGRVVPESPLFHGRVGLYGGPGVVRPPLRRGRELDAGGPGRCVGGTEGAPECSAGSGLSGVRLTRACGSSGPGGGPPRQT
jgi:predicted metalloprotease with PDZ domain